MYMSAFAKRDVLQRYVASTIDVVSDYPLHRFLSFRHPGGTDLVFAFPKISDGWVCINNALSETLNNFPSKISPLGIRVRSTVQDITTSGITDGHEPLPPREIDVTFLDNFSHDHRPLLIGLFTPYRLEYIILLYIPKPKKLPLHRTFLSKFVTCWLLQMTDT